jgi:serine/threonine-protein kinase
MDTTHLDPARPATRSPSDPLHDPRSLGEFRIMRRLGEGGMGSVYLGYHEEQGQQVAIKVLSDHMTGNQVLVDRFYREAKSGALLNHPNIVRTIIVGQDQATGKHYLVLEFIDGPSAHALLDQHGKLSVGDAVHIALDIARALEHAHSRNVIHRDIKPDNILITRSGVSKLADLGLAKRTDETSHLTVARQGFGTTYYMPYEQAINAKRADYRSDIYALGATLYHLVTGQVPFPGENHLEVVEKKERGNFEPASHSCPDVPPELDAILAKMLARDPGDRYQTASELLVDLDRSGLASLVPSFADPELARQDPWVRACIASSAQPTRPDLDAPPARLDVAGATAKRWYLRFRGRDGRWYRVRTTTKVIADRLRDGRLPDDAQARRLDDERFRAVRDFPEFRDIKCRRTRRRKRKPIPAEAAGRTVPTPSVNGESKNQPEEDFGSSRLIKVAGVATAAALLLAAAVIAYIVFHGAN